MVLSLSQTVRLWIEGQGQKGSLVYLLRKRGETTASSAGTHPWGDRPSEPKAARANRVHCRQLWRKRWVGCLALHLRPMNLLQTLLLRKGLMLRGGLLVVPRLPRSYRRR